MITSLTIKNYKKIKVATFECKKINIFVGTNNSGKSSVLSALHFCLTAWNPNIMNQPKKKKKTSRTILFSDNDLLYSPTANISTIANGNQLPNKTDVHNTMIENKESPMFFDITINHSNDNNTMTLTKTEGSYSIELTPLSWIKTPPELYSAYVPGLSGVLYQEEVMTVKRIQKDSFYFGTAGNVLQNVLKLIFDSDKREGFENDLKRVFEGKFSIKIPENNYNFYIDTTVMEKGMDKEIPLCQMGVGFLKIVQILAYKHLYNPNVLLIDEPEAHLHGHLLTRVLNVFSSWAYNPDTPCQLFITTHSSQLLEKVSEQEDLKETYNIVQMDNGIPTPIIELNSSLPTILDKLGDSFIEIDNSPNKIIFITEDNKGDMLRTLIEKMKKDIKEHMIYCSANGCSNMINKIRSIRNTHREVPILCHIDLDAKNIIDKQLKADKLDEDKNIHIWYTDEVCLEGQCLQEHIFENIIKKYDQYNNEANKLVIRGFLLTAWNDMSNKLMKHRSPSEIDQEISNMKGKILDNFDLCEELLRILNYSREQCHEIENSGLGKVVKDLDKNLARLIDRDLKTLFSEISEIKSLKEILDNIESNLKELIAYDKEKYGL